MAGLAVIAGRSAARWRRGGDDRRRPVAERVPLFVHVAALLALAFLVAVVAGLGMWVAVGRPDLSSATTSGAGTAAWSIANTFDALKIVLAIVAGIGGVVALTVAYRRQDHSEAAEHRENTKLFNERFGKAAEQLGADKSAIRLTGTYAMAGLADDWEEGRQTCIDVLCAYLRAPYDSAARDEQQVRHTIVILIRAHLTPELIDTSRRPRWHGYRFDLRGATLDGGDLSRIDLREGTFLNLRGAVITDGEVSFSGAKFSGGTAAFNEARFLGGTVSFVGAHFSGGTVSFSDAEVSGGTVSFIGAQFSGGAVSFSDARFSGGTVAFNSADFAGGTVAFRDADFAGGHVDFSTPRSWSAPPIGVVSTQRGVSWPATAS
ncbi:pentapeptide repeat-containing protein [Paractinoplanes rishiriensis]|uniref:pentapeptide repeat-containing protein n=1 Tax=Paractinoplanes rishiriensis TaxID=1050105 RepID=UPI001943A153|nr:pentapeptide repeat-containing protein [Actinoplanes rishiriensis]